MPNSRIYILKGRLRRVVSASRDQLTLAQSLMGLVFKACHELHEPAISAIIGELLMDVASKCQIVLNDSIEIETDFS